MIERERFATRRRSAPVLVDHTLFSMSPDGPTRARMALIALLALVAIAALGALRTRLPIVHGTRDLADLHTPTWPALALVLGVGHAVLTDGALDGAGTPLLIGFGALGLVGVAAAHAAGGSPGRTKALP